MLVLLVVCVCVCVVSVQSNYEPLNRNNDCIGQWSWYYRGCWHQTCPPLEIQILNMTTTNKVESAH